MSQSTASPLQPVAEMYGRWTLDCVVELARAIAYDFVARPRHYRQVPEDVSETLSRFRFSTGVDTNWPNGLQRATSYRAFLVPACRSMGNLRAAAVALTQAATEQAQRTQRETFLDEASALQPSLQTFEGRAAATQEHLTREIFENAVKVLRCEEVARVFGLPPAPDGAWPLGGMLDGDAAYLCQEIDRRLMRLGTTGTVSQQKFLVLQRVAYYGSQTIAGALEDRARLEDERRLDALVQSAYRWATALRDLLPGIDIVRAWKDIEYRSRLTSAERDLLPPNPAGSIELEGSGLEDIVAAGRLGVAAPTMTVAGEVCCCTGDFCDDPTDPDPGPNGRPPGPRTWSGETTCPAHQCDVVIA